ncbi:CdaR family transcriptional regulator [Alicyclobacillus dauci]|uniref:Helix-turn-helix domain-containing protein n=1 Tax=Alicyclobacillus dauci TaxID=1475485 RepID=A0ABY6Z4I4_9BACL|nr:sugar diacid recognition domain-containing protein [Alicyclobacillus dauci]WAH37789.1 helix-turn-helix domain-containing protein [Alicyclobacillus dauci]
MRITTQLAQPIVDRLLEILDYNVNIMNDAGVIVASGEPERLNERHEGALEVLRRQSELVITGAQAHEFAGSKAGVNLPIQFQQHIVGVVGITGEPNEIYPFANLAKTTVELLLNQAFLSQQQAYRYRALQTWVDELTAPTAPDVRQLEAAADALAIEIATPGTICLISLRSLPEVGHIADMDAIYDHVERHLPPNAICARTKRAIFLAWPSETPSQENTERFAEQWLKPFLSRDAICAIASANAGVEGYRRAYIQASHTMELLRVQTSKRIAHAETMRFERFVLTLDENLKAELNDTIGQLWTGVDEVEQSTLMCYFTHACNAAQTAQSLHIHRNTLTYRLDRIKAIVGLDPRNFHDATLLYMFVIHHQLQRPSQANQ